MNDRHVAEALRSNTPLILVEAPAGFGKTFQGAEYALYLLPKLFPGRLLILTHTNAACDVFAERTGRFGSRVEIRTIDSLITHIASAYHKALGLPTDVAVWARQQGDDGFNSLAVKVATLLARAPAIAVSIASRYPYVICDEHQDSSEAQHKIILSIYHAGAFMRIFGDPMQAIYAKRQDCDAWERRWAELATDAAKIHKLENPHRWRVSAPELGDWISEARTALQAGREIDLRGDLPHGLTLIRADNTAQAHGQCIVCPDERHAIDCFVSAASDLLVLSSTNDMVRGLRAFFNRRIPIWEGHTRDALSRLSLACQKHSGDSGTVACVFIEFVQDVATGFSNTKYGNIIRREVAEGCTSRRTKIPAKLQEIARYIVERPDHSGVAQALAKLGELMRTDDAFKEVRLDLRREFSEAVRLARYDDIDEGIVAITHWRSVSRISPPSKAISTVHKAKGLERENILILPCDRQHFGDSAAKRRLLYVALSRATKSLALVIPNSSPSPLFRV